MWFALAGIERVKQNTHSCLGISSRTKGTEAVCRVIGLQIWTCWHAHCKASLNDLYICIKHTKEGYLLMWEWRFNTSSIRWNKLEQNKRATSLSIGSQTFDIVHSFMIEDSFIVITIRCHVNCLSWHTVFSSIWSDISVHSRRTSKSIKDVPLKWASGDVWFHRDVSKQTVLAARPGTGLGLFHLPLCPTASHGVSQKPLTTQHTSHVPWYLVNLYFVVHCVTLWLCGVTSSD